MLLVAASPTQPRAFQPPGRRFAASMTGSTALSRKPAPISIKSETPPSGSLSRDKDSITDNEVSLAVFIPLRLSVVFLTFDNSLFRLVWFLLSVSMARLIKLLSALTCESAWDRVFSVTHGYFELILLNSCPISTINSPFN